MRTVVVDASVMVDVLVETEKAGSARAALADAELVAPALIDVEVLSALARMERAEVLTAVEADAVVAEWEQAAIGRVGLAALTPWVWARRHSTRISDAYYLELAHCVDAPLITSDARLARGPHPDIEVTLIE